MNEIEVKIKLQNKEEFCQKLKDLGCILSDPITQNDVIFLPQTMKEYKIVEGDIVVRTRKQDHNKLFTLKRQKSHQLESKEIEFEIGDIDKMHEVLVLLGYKEFIRVNKTRTNTKYQNYDISIDSVEHLGDFVEVEVLTDEDVDVPKVQEKMVEFLKGLGEDMSERVFIPYDTQMYNHKSLKQ